MKRTIMLFSLPVWVWAFLLASDCHISKPEVRPIVAASTRDTVRILDSMVAADSSGMAIIETQLAQIDAMLSAYEQKPATHKRKKRAADPILVSPY